MNCSCFIHVKNRPEKFDRYADEKKYFGLKDKKKAGTILKIEGKYLLVQSRHIAWGFPKGSKEGNETEKETAIRETFEETHIDVSNNIDGKKRNIDSCTYYFCNFEDGFETMKEYYVNKYKFSKEITGIAILCENCLRTKRVHFNKAVRDHFKIERIPRTHPPLVSFEEWKNRKG